MSQPSAIVHPEPCASTDLTHAFDHEVIAKAAEQIERRRTLLYEFDLYSFEIPGYLDSPFAAEVRATLGDRGDFGRDGVPS